MIFLTMLLWFPDPRELVFGWEPSEEVGGYSHLISFMVLGILFELDRRRFSFEFLCLILLCYAMFTEFGQIFFPPRVFDWADLIQNFAGLIIGLQIGNIAKNTYKFIVKFFCNRS
jgi:VanZ family protein